MPTSFPSHILAQLQASFLAIVLPRVLSHGRVSFRHLKCRHRREDIIQEMIGLSWQWHLRLAEKGRDATLFPTALASYAARRALWPPFLRPEKGQRGPVAPGPAGAWLRGGEAARLQYAQWQSPRRGAARQHRLPGA
jgi:hypothetical protein